MNQLKFIISLPFLLLFIASCVPKLGLPEAEVKQFKIAAINITASNRSIRWPDAEHVFLKKSGIPIVQPPSGRGDDSSDGLYDNMLRAIRSPKGQAFLKNRLSERLRFGISLILKEHLTGKRRVNININVSTFQTSPAAAKLIINIPHRLIAEVKIMDVATGKQIGKTTSLSAEAGTTGGITGILIESFSGLPSDRLVANFSLGLKRYLLPNS